MSSHRVVPVVLLAGLVVAGCDVNIHEGKASVGVFAADATDEWTHHYPLGGDGVVEIVNLNGPVEISAGTAGTVDVHATVVAKALSEAGARRLLSRGSVQERIEPARVHIETVIPRGERGSYVASYAVRIPPGTRADVSATNGSLTATGLDGPLKAVVVNGKMDLSNLSGRVDGLVANGALTLRLSRVTAAVRLEITNGPLVLEIPSTAGANLSARVVNGGMTVSGLGADETSGRRIRNLEKPLNGGGPDIMVRVTNGRLTIEGK